MSDPLSPGATIGILGGGQLGRMLALYGHRLGLNAHIYCPDPQSPAFAVTPHKTVAAYDDEAALEAFAKRVDVVTYEFENVPVETAAIIARHCPVRPGPLALETAQDRLTEKDFLSNLGIPVAPYATVDNADDLERALEAIGAPAVLKTRRLGYDGKGQAMIRSLDDAAEALEAMKGAPAILEGFIAFDREISVIAARSTDGSMAAYDPAENVHRDHILNTSTVPARISEEMSDTAIAMAGMILEDLDYVGVIGVEFFASDDGRLIVNEIAPRVHNSGHWTEAGCLVSQFEQHMRAVAGWPLGTTRRHANVEMTNLIGDEINIVSGAESADAQVHHYGKAEARPGRKMGHINRITGPAG